jgi:hypothetical protein
MSDKPTIRPRGMVPDCRSAPQHNIVLINAKTHEARCAGLMRLLQALDLEVQTCACPIALRFPSAFRIPSRFRIGAVNIVVTKAMMTIMVKSVGVKAPTL